MAKAITTSPVRSDDFSRQVRSDDFSRLVCSDDFSRQVRSDDFSRQVRSDDFSRLVCSDDFSRQKSSKSLETGLLRHPLTAVFTTIRYRGCGGNAPTQGFHPCTPYPDSTKSAVEKHENH